MRRVSKNVGGIGGDDVGREASIALRAWSPVQLSRATTR
jgi:hypothetical protein